MKSSENHIALWWLFFVKPIKHLAQVDDFHMLLDNNVFEYFKYLLPFHSITISKYFRAPHFIIDD